MTAGKSNFQVFISSPGGLETEKAIALSEIQMLLEQQHLVGEPGLDVIAWPHDIAAGSANYGQSVINRQIADFDILLCVIGTRMGTRTPRANSGTEEEFDRAIEAILRGRRVQVLLFFSNALVRVQDIDPQQLFLIKAFQVKASRLGVLYQYYGDPEAFRHLVKISLREAYDSLRQGLQHSRYSTQYVTTPQFGSKIIETPDFILKDGLGPQRAADHLIPLAPYQGYDVRIAGTVTTSSEYFRFGFKYYDAREPLYSAYSVQTVGQNIVFHIAKNMDKPEWFWTSYQASYRANDNSYIPATAGATTARFEITITPAEIITFYLNDQQLYTHRFPIDGVPNIALLAWGDEHHFQCDIAHLRVEIQPRAQP